MSVRGANTVADTIEAGLQRAKGLREKEERRQRVVLLAAAGVKLDEIGWRVGLKTDYVKQVVREARQDVRRPEPDDGERFDDSGVNVMWRLGSEADRREWIRRRAAEGARQTLEALQS